MANGFMQQIWHHLLKMLCTVLQQDPKSVRGAFNAQFTVENLPMFYFLPRQDYDPAAVLEIVRRTHIDCIFFPTLLWELYNLQNEHSSLKGDAPSGKFIRNILLPARLSCVEECKLQHPALWMQLSCRASPC